MTIAVFGGTGKTGRLVVQQALAAGHKVRVLARDPDKIAPAFGLEFIKGDVLDGGRVMATVVGCDAVIVALGTTKGGRPDLCSRGTELIVQAANKVGARRLSVVTSLGVGDSRDEVPWFFKLIAALFLKPIMDDKETQEATVRQSGLEWTLVRPTGLVEGPATSTALLGKGRLKDALPAGRKPTGRISRADVAAFLLKTVTEAGYERSTWFITN